MSFRPMQNDTTGIYNIFALVVKAKDRSFCAVLLLWEIILHIVLGEKICKIVRNTQKGSISQSTEVSGEMLMTTKKDFDPRTMQIIP